MRKVMFKFGFIVLLLIFYFNPIYEVKAEEPFGGFNHIYHITSLEVNTGNSTLDFKGYAYIDHTDNYGGVNLRTWIIASNGSDEYRVQVEYQNQPSNYDYYFVRCMQNSSNPVCTMNHAREIQSGNLRRTNCNLSGQSDCAYFNVEFTATINLSEMISKLGSSNDISFKIITETDTSASTVRLESPLGVSEQLCSIKGQAPGSCDGKISIGTDSYIYINGLSNKVIVTATEARARNVDASKSVVSSTIFFQRDVPFTVSSHVTGSSFEKNGFTSKTNYYIVCSRKTSSAIIPSDSCENKYYVYESWVKTDGVMSVSFTPPSITESKTCSGGVTSKSVVCGSDPVFFEDCVDKSVSTSVIYTLTPQEQAQATIYRKDIGAWDVCGPKDFRYEVNLNTNVLIHEDGVFSFESISDSVYAGRGFNFPVIKYFNSVRWEYGEDLNIKTTSVNYGKWIERLEDKTETKWVWCYENGIDGLGNVCSYPNQYYVVVVNLGKTYTYECTYDNVATVNYSSYLSELNVKAEQVVKSNIDQSKINGSIVKSYDSNTVSFTKKTVDGTWERFWGDGEYSVGYQFNMADAYVKLIGDNASTVKYSNSELSNYQHIGNKYFVPLLYPEQSFPLDITQNNISFVNGITWNLSGTCSTNVKNKVFDVPSDGGGGGVTPKFRYRSIDLSTPFPKSVPVNWKNWWNNNTNKNRITNTYNNGVIYSVTLVAGNSNGGKLGTNVINAIDTDYNSWSGISKTGVSSFVNNSYFTKNNTNSWCAIGEFDPSCDK